MGSCALYASGWRLSTDPKPGVGYVGLAASQLFQLGWLSKNDVLNITANGKYQINSLSSNSGIRAAFIETRGQRLWIEWRAAINQDADLPFSWASMNQKRIRGLGTTNVGSLLLKTHLGDGGTIFWNAVDFGKRVSQWDVTIESLSKTGYFRVSGLPGFDTPPESTTTTTTASTTSTTTRSTTEDPSLTDPPELVLPPGPSCSASGSQGACVKRSVCGNQFGLSLRGCTKGLVCCYI